MMKIGILFTNKNHLKSFLYHMSSVIRQIFFPSETIAKSRSIIYDRSRSLGMFRKGKTSIVAKFHRTDLVIFSHSRERKCQSYSRINTVL